MPEVNLAIDYSKVKAGEEKIADLAQRVSKADLRAATNQSIDYLLDLTRSLSDEQIIFEPHDPDANDPYAATEEEKNISWTFAHLIAHVSASSEEGAAFSSLLARGIVITERPRYETPWREITTQAACIQRLEESRRMRLAYLDTWPDTPFLDVYRAQSERSIERVGKLNAPASFLYALSHEVGHYAQIKDVARQARDAALVD